MGRILVVLAVLVAALSATADRAAALTANFDFRLPVHLSSFGEAGSYSFNSSGLGLKVGAGVIDGDVMRANGDAKVTRAPTGLGVRNWELDRWEVDGVLGRDGLLFDFDRDVQIERIWFSHVDGDDGFALFGEDSGALRAVGGNIDIPGSGFFGSRSFSSGLIGDLFGIGAGDWTDDFRIAGIQVSFEDVLSTPLPGPLALIGAAFAALGFSLRRRTAAA